MKQCALKEMVLTGEFEEPLAPSAAALLAPRERRAHLPRVRARQHLSCARLLQP